MEDEIWREFIAMCARAGKSASRAAAELDAEGPGNLSSKIRTTVFRGLKGG
jgi:predicted DNA-binding ribbon-helix-helix protein